MSMLPEDAPWSPAVLVNSVVAHLLLSSSELVTLNLLEFSFIGGLGLTLAVRQCFILRFQMPPAHYRWQFETCIYDNVSQPIAAFQ